MTVSFYTSGGDLGFEHDAEEIDICPMISRGNNIWKVSRNNTSWLLERWRSSSIWWKTFTHPPINLSQSFKLYILFEGWARKALTNLETSSSSQNRMASNTFLRIRTWCKPWFSPNSWTRLWIWGLWLIRFWTEPDGIKMEIQLRLFTTYHVHSMSLWQCNQV